IRLLNTDGITGPITLWVDDVSVNEAAGPTVEGFEGFVVGDEVIFQEPSFSGSTSGNLVAGSTAGVTDDMAYTGGQSYRADLQFIDADATRWLRYTTFQSANVPNPWIRTIEPGAPAPTVTFWAKAIAIPEPSTMLLSLVGGIGLLAVRRIR
ncbi:MAG: PEP-CTERM sorting domain-containing protein, partial [Aeoliella sp.]